MQAFLLHLMMFVCLFVCFLAASEEPPLGFEEPPLGLAVNPVPVFVDGNLVMASTCGSCHSRHTNYLLDTVSHGAWWVWASVISFLFLFNIVLFFFFLSFSFGRQWVLRR